MDWSLQFSTGGQAEYDAVMGPALESVPTIPPPAVTAFVVYNTHAGS